MLLKWKGVAMVDQRAFLVEKGRCECVCVCCWGDSGGGMGVFFFLFFDQLVQKVQQFAKSTTRTSHYTFKQQKSTFWVQGSTFLPSFESAKFIIIIFFQLCFISRL